ncbi:MAG: ribosome maturation factor RimP, partial [Clostridia bacterium]|nr:ribosome maturation factor RimP [Clostridia bacterium]
MNPYGKKNIAGTVWDLVEPTANELGYSIWDVEYVKEGADMYLRITIDSEEGIDIDDCERMTRAIDPLLDEADPIEDFYYLEVSSPGVERELRTDEHVKKSIGQKVLAKLFTAKDGQKS